MMSYFLMMFVLLQLKGLTDSQTIHVCTSGNGEQCNIDCETTNQADAISFTHPQRGSAGGCTSGGTCVPNLGYSVARVNSTFTRLTIPSLNCTADRGDWTCSYGSTPSTPVLLPCPSSFGSGLTIDVTGNTVTCQLNCQSPISGFSSLEVYKIQSGTTSLLQTVTSITGSTPAAADGCNSGEQNVILTRDVSDVCGPSKFQCTFNNIYLGPGNSSESAEIPLTCENYINYYNWHILVGWIVGVLIIPVAGLVCFIFNVFIVKKSHTKWSGDNQKKIKLGLTLGAGVLVSLIVCIIIATQVCFSTFSSAFGVGIGVSFGIMFICVIIIVVILFTCMKDIGGACHKYIPTRT